MSFRMVSKSVTLNDLERRNGSLRYFTESSSFRSALLLRPGKLKRRKIRGVDSVGG